MGRSCSRKLRNASAPLTPSSSEEVADSLEAVAVATVGSAASYAESSEARSVGRAGAFGDGGSASFLTRPT